jgi:hypothetical protein
LQRDVHYDAARTEEEEAALTSYENKISDGWPAAAGTLDGAWLRVEGGIS